LISLSKLENKAKKIYFKLNHYIYLKWVEGDS